MTSGPPPLADWLLRRVLPRNSDGDTIRGDLREEFARRVAEPGSASAWYWRAVLSIAFRYRSNRDAFGAASERQSWLDAARHDLRYAVRTLARTRAFTIVVILTLALGIGANTAIFSALNAVLLRSLPYPDADRLVRLVPFNPSAGIASSNASAPDLLDWRRAATSFEAIGAFSTFSTTMRGQDGAERIPSAEISGLFEVLGTPPTLGRGFTTDDMRPEPGVAIVGHDLWRRYFGARADVLGRPLRSGAPTTIVGVAPQGFSYPEDVELWFPFAPSPSEPRYNRILEVVARLKRGVTIARAQAELDTISARLDRQYHDTNSGWRVRVVPLRDFVVGDARQTLLLLFGGVTLVMLVACANVANLFLANASMRQREIAVRAAIGAHRSRIVRQVLTESVLLSCTAGALGLVIGHWGMRLLATMGAKDIPRLEQVSLDWTVLLFLAGISLATGIVFGLAPALQLSRSDLVHALREGSHGSGTRGRTRRLLVVAEVAIALVLLVAAALIGRSFQGLQRVDVGFNPANLLTMQVSLAGPRYHEPGAASAYFMEAVKRLSATPGVRSAAAALSLPVGGGGFYLGRGFVRPSHPNPPDGYGAMFQIVTPGYFRALGAPLLQGRDFDAHDDASSAPVVIVNQSLARHQFAGENPIGQKVLVWRDENVAREVIGVVGDLKPANLADSAPSEMYVPIAQSDCSFMTFVIRTTADPGSAVPAAKATLQALDAAQATYGVKSFDAIMGSALARQRFSLWLFAAFAGLALLLAAVGLYAVMSQVVAGRAREMGVRLALGARPTEVRWLVVRQGMSLFAIGLICGLALSLAAMRLLGNLLYDVTPTDPSTLGSTALVMCAVAWLSSYVPARRATRLDPATVLRTD